MQRSPSGFANSRSHMSFWAGLGWMQLGFAVGSCLLGWSVTHYTNFWWSFVVSAALFTFIAGNIVIMPLYGALHAWRGGGFLSLIIAFGLGAPLAWLLVSLVNRSAAQGRVIDRETGEPIDMFQAAFDWTVVVNLLHVSAVGIASVLVVWAVQAALRRLLAPRRSHAE